ncbi:hypothetical protein, partial [Austwickia chelonae]
MPPPRSADSPSNRQGYDTTTASTYDDACPAAAPTGRPPTVSLPASAGKVDDVLRREEPRPTHLDDARQPAARPGLSPRRPVKKDEIMNVHLIHMTRHLPLHDRGSDRPRTRRAAEITLQVRRTAR